MDGEAGWPNGRGSWLVNHKREDRSPPTSKVLLFAMIRSVVKSFKVPDVDVVAARMSNESALTRMTDSTQKTLVRLTLVLDG